MKFEPDFAPLCESFFIKRLIAQRKASSHTIAAYAHTFRSRDRNAFTWYQLCDVPRVRAALRSGENFQVPAITGAGASLTERRI
jgi:hypothetical protein